MEMSLSTSPLAERLPPAPPAVTIRPVRSEPSDGELITRVGSGDRNAFEALYRRYSRPVFGLALRRLGDRGRAEEAVQETFASVWRAAGSYRPQRGPGAPWLYAGARNALAEKAATDPPPERAESGWVAWRVHAALADLPDSERVVLELAYWGERSQSE